MCFSAVSHTGSRCVLRPPRLATVAASRKSAVCCCTVMHERWVPHKLVVKFCIVCHMGPHGGARNPTDLFLSLSLPANAQSTIWAPINRGGVLPVYKFAQLLAKIQTKCRRQKLPLISISSFSIFFWFVISLTFFFRLFGREEHLIHTR